MHNLCLIIPTKDRPFELERLFNSIKTQSIRPVQIIVVDGGEPGVRCLVNNFPELSIDYLQVLPPGLTRQRNAGLRVVRDEIDLVGFLDDDIVLEPDCLKNMLIFWKSAENKIGGAGFNIIDAIPAQKPRWAEYLMRRYFRNKKPGSLLRNGRNIPYCPASTTSETEWLCGGATIWRKKVFKEFEYDEWFATYGIVEDIDFSYRVSRQYSLAIVADAQVKHIELPKKNQFLWAYVITMNNMYFSSKHRAFSQLSCAKSFFIEGLKCIAYGILLRDKNYIQRGIGHLWAVCRRFSCGLHRVERQVKSNLYSISPSSIT
ncbi:MAG: glycosyltransferase [Nitrospirae bacterium]|nr:glycosyltransferase [Nitrospirota bacterium]MCL5976708.1 glycosyltransferase [Nitrospirota bacterium]